jgi:chromosome segregation ATPase
MKTKDFLFVPVFSLVFLFPIFANGYSITDVEDMMKELGSTEVEIGKAETAKAELKEEEKRLIATKELLKGAFENWKKEQHKHNEEAKKKHAAVDNYNARCAGTFSDPNYVAKCRSEAEVLRAWKNRIDERAKTIRGKKAMIDGRVKDLSQATLKWAEKTKANNATLDDLYVKQEKLIRKIKLHMASPWFLRDLKIRSDVSQECREMKSLEDAHRCLQRVWDGAK